MSKPAYQMRAYPPPALPQTLAGRIEQIEAWLNNVDEDGNPDPLITRELAERLLTGVFKPRKCHCKYCEARRRGDPQIRRDWYMEPVDATVGRGRMGS